MTGSSLDAAYFEGIFADDDDPWQLASSEYEARKFARTHDALADRRYARALEVGCAHGVLTGTLIGLCDAVLAIDISARALVKAHERVGERPGLAFRRMTFPRETPETTGFDLVILSEVAYYWDSPDLRRAAAWLGTAIAPGGRVILVHYTGETDYPQTADAAVDALWTGSAGAFEIERRERHEGYRLDLWVRK